MLAGIAVGGPRDGIRLIAGMYWDGRVRKPQTDPRYIKTTCYPGHYQWVAEWKIWQWIPDKKKPLKQAG